MISSMTGYGRAVGFEKERQIVVEISSVNRRGLDVLVSLPREWQQFEKEIVSAVQEHVSRGRIQVLISSEISSEDEKVLFDPLATGTALRELEELAKKEEIPFQPDLRLLFDLAVFAHGKAGLTPAGEISELLMKIVREAVLEMKTMRNSEGKTLAEDLDLRKEKLLKALEEIRKGAKEVLPNYREELMKRLRQAGLELDLDDERVLKEIALFADRADISEELTRLESHFNQFGEFLKSAEPVGRKFEFLLQEISRELNTVGSKSNSSLISKIVIDCKSEVERIREQILNIE